MKNYHPNRLQEARIYAASIHRKIALEAECNPNFGFASHVSDAQRNAYINNQIALAEEIENGKHDHNFTVMQRMEYFLTGECRALLP